MVNNILGNIYATDPSGHLSPDLGMDEVRSKSWNTLLLAPAAFITTVYNPDRPDIEEPTTKTKEPSQYKNNTGSSDTTN